MAGFLGSLQYVLEEGPQYEWLQDTSVAIFAAVCLVSAIAFFWRVLTAREPIVDIRTFTDRNFGVGCLISFCLGIGLYGLTYVYPRYLAEVRGYSALMIGETMDRPMAIQPNRSENGFTHSLPFRTSQL